jgi:DNA modification methylase
MPELSIGDVQFVKELYPRLKEDDAAIERYRAAIEKLPPIVVARGGILVDGFHRWQAFKRENRTEVPFVDLGNLSDAQIIRESIERNAKHGQQLSAADKKNLAGQLWWSFASMPNGERTSEIAELLSVSTDSVERWTKEARQQEKDALKAKAYDLWLDCMSYREIGEALGVDDKTVAAWTAEKTAAAGNSAPPVSQQHFDIWSFTKANGESSYFGRMPPQVVENLLWLYTEPGDVVVDPFAGGGTTINVAKDMGRRVFASDRKPSTPMLPIHEHDITTGWNPDAPKKAKLILLDPPYWQQAEGRYSDSPDDLGNMSLAAFYDAWAKVVTACAERLEPGGVLAYIISPTQAENGDVVDHATDMLRACWAAGLNVKRRIIVPYQTQQATGQQVTWARENKRLLKLYRDLVVMSHV